MSSPASVENHIPGSGMNETSDPEKKSLARSQSEPTLPARAAPAEKQGQLPHERRKGYNVISTSNYYRAERRGSGAFNSARSYVLVDRETEAGDGTYEEYIPDGRLL